MTVVQAAAPLAFMLTAAAASFASPPAVSGNAAAGDASRGAVLYAARCGGCHSLRDNGAGPRHVGLLGRRAGTQPGYEYSEALVGSRIVWSAIALDRWLADPGATVPGNKMLVQLANDPRDRADLIAYLAQATR